MVMRKSSLLKFYGDLINSYGCFKWQQICSICGNHNPVLSSFMIINGFVTRLKRRGSHVEQELLIFADYTPVFSGVRVTWSLVCSAMFCRSLFVPSSFFFWPLYCPSFFDLLLLITPLVSSKPSYKCTQFERYKHFYSFQKE